MSKLSHYLKNIFYFLLFIQIVPLLVSGIIKQYATFFEPKTKVAVLPIKGTLTSASYYIKHLRDFFKDPHIKAIVLSLETPGGKAGTSQAIYEEIKALKAENLKPIVSLVENICASGGYYIASATDNIIATPSAFIGSIGVYIAQPHLKAFIEQFKIEYDVIKTGDYKTTGDPLLSQTPEQKALLQGLTNDTYNQFVHDVAQARPKLSLAESAQWANGQIFTGRQGLEKGLVDELGSFSTLEKVLRQKTTIEGKIEWIYPPKPSPFKDFFGQNNDEYPDSESYAGWIIEGMKSYLGITTSGMHT